MNDVRKPLFQLFVATMPDFIAPRGPGVTVGQCYSWAHRRLVRVWIGNKQITLYYWRTP